MVEGIKITDQQVIFLILHQCIEFNMKPFYELFEYQLLLESVDIYIYGQGDPASTIEGPYSPSHIVQITNFWKFLHEYTAWKNQNLSQNFKLI